MDSERRGSQLYAGVRQLGLLGTVTLALGELGNWELSYEIEIHCSGQSAKVVNLFPRIEDRTSAAEFLICQLKV